MQSKWFKLKPKVLLLRKEGKSIKYINKLLGVPMSTLSGWLKSVKLTKKQKQTLDMSWKRSLVKARKKAVIWHNEQKSLRIKKAKEEAYKILQKINFRDKNIIDLVLAILYLGEGFKSKKTGMGNSDPLILKFFLYCMVNIYKMKTDDIRFDLHLRYDQNPLEIKKFWSKELNIPLEKFKYVSVDIRTKGKKTYPNYKGVCMIDCANIAIQRKLVYLSKYYCEEITKNLGG